MTETEVRGLLNAYREMCGRLGHLETETRRLKRAYATMKRDLTETLAGPRAQVLSDMPKGGSLPSSQVERAAIKLATENAEELRAINAEIEAVRREIERVRDRISYVDAWLDGLTERERLVIQRRAINGETWEEVGRAYADRFGLELNDDSLMRIRRSAMRHIFRMAADVSKNGG